jgi:hypothetical protein
MIVESRLKVAENRSTFLLASSFGLISSLRPAKPAREGNRVMRGDLTR